MTTKKSLTKRTTDSRPAKKLVAPKGKKISNLSPSSFSFTKVVDKPSVNLS